MTLDSLLSEYQALQERVRCAETQRDELAEALARLAKPALQARLEAAVVCLAKLVRQLERVQGYSTHEQQQELREARAVIAEGV